MSISVHIMNTNNVQKKNWQNAFDTLERLLLKQFLIQINLI